MKLLYLVCFSLLAFTAVNGFAQEEVFESRFKQANKLLQEGHYKQAAQYFEELAMKNPMNANVAWKAGYAWLNGPEQRYRALPHFELAASSISPEYAPDDPAETRAPAEALLHLGIAYHQAFRFDDAIEAFTKYRELVAAHDKSNLARVDMLIRNSNAARQMIVMEGSTMVKNAGSSINTQAPEYSPLITADEDMILFRSRRIAADRDKKEKGMAEDLFVAVRQENGLWKNPVSIGRNIFHPDYETSVGLSSDGQKLFIYRNGKKNQGVYVSTLQGDVWSAPVPEGNSLNTEDWETSGSISVLGDQLFFSSARKGGYGGLDLYMSRRLPNGDWSLPINLGAGVNTAGDETTPFIHPDGRTLFFSSTGYTGAGGYDVFFSMKNHKGGWETPMNIGYPLNTVYDDISFVITANGRNAYYSSYRDDGFGDQDIFHATFADNAEKPLALIRGVVRGYYGGVPDNVEILITDMESGELYGVYYPNSKSGKYLFILPTGRKYNVSYEAEGHLFHSENLDVSDNENYYEINRAVDLSPLTIGSKTVLRNIHFENEKADLPEGAALELEKIVKLYNETPGIYIEIAGYADPGEHKDLQQELSEKRAQVVVEALVKMGIPVDRIQGRGYGTAIRQPTGTVSGQEEETANRRVELKILQTD